MSDPGGNFANAAAPVAVDMTSIEAITAAARAFQDFREHFGPPLRRLIVSPMGYEVILSAAALTGSETGVPIQVEPYLNGVTIIPVYLRADGVEVPGRPIKLGGAS